ncbi:hypothetical protein V6N11_082884 [Hibiscus sabdariffa]|uniref:Uncharacterized protein n=1 Tax=Hibiscus sabdariffa TaxID=183260 RepID=A0ABR2QKA0_9ROSI
MPKEKYGPCIQVQHRKNQRAFAGKGHNVTNIEDKSTTTALRIEDESTTVAAGIVTNIEGHNVANLATGLAQTYKDHLNTIHGEVAATGDVIQVPVSLSPTKHSAVKLRDRRLESPYEILRATRVEGGKDLLGPVIVWCLSKTSSKMTVASSISGVATIGVSEEVPADTVSVQWRDNNAFDDDDGMVRFSEPNVDHCMVVSFVMENEEWDVDQLLFLLPSDCVQCILAILLPSPMFEPDRIGWWGAPNFKFTIKSSYKRISSHSGMIQDKA